MTAVEKFWKDVQDILPSSVDTETGIKLVRAYEQAKEMEKEQKIEFACKVAEVSAEKYIQGKTTEQIAEELNKLE